MALALGLIFILLGSEASQVAARTLRGTEVTAPKLSNQTQHERINLAKAPHLGSQVFGVPANLSANFGIVSAAAAVPFTPKNVPDDVEFKILKATHLKTGEQSACLCPLGQFWHWRINKCIEHGGWGYECGFFPREHWHRVCKDGLTCKKLPETKDNYHSHGIYRGEWKAKPATCLNCDKEDGCKYGMERHMEECVRKNDLSGEACATVRVTVPITAEATDTEKATVKVKVKGPPTDATSTAEATATATARIPGTNRNVSATATEEASVNITHRHPITKEVTASHTSTVEHEAKGVSEKTACVAAAEAYELETGKELETEKGSKADKGSGGSEVKVTKDGVVPEVGNELAARVVSKADEVAFERAFERAYAEAKKAGWLDANDNAEKLAKAKAYEEARLKAEAKARELAGAKAEAGSNKAAQQAAEDRAQKAAEEAARIEAERLARAKAEAAAKGPTKEEKAAAQSKIDRRRAADNSGASRAAARAAAETAQRKAEGEPPTVEDAINSIAAAENAGQGYQEGKGKGIAGGEAAAKALMDGVNNMLKGKPEAPRASQHKEEKVFVKMTPKQKASMYP